MVITLTFESVHCRSTKTLTKSECWNAERSSWWLFDVYFSLKSKFTSLLKISLNRQSIMRSLFTPSPRPLTPVTFLSRCRHKRCRKWLMVDQDRPEVVLLIILQNDLKKLLKWVFYTSSNIFAFCSWFLHYAYGYLWRAIAMAIYCITRMVWEGISPFHNLTVNESGYFTVWSQPHTATFS